MSPSHLRDIPSVDRVLQALGDVALPRLIVLRAVRRELTALRAHGTVVPHRLQRAQKARHIDHAGGRRQFALAIHLRL